MCVICMWILIWNRTLDCIWERIRKKSKADLLGRLSCSLYNCIECTLALDSMRQVKRFFVAESHKPDAHEIYEFIAHANNTMSACIVVMLVYLPF